MEREPRLLVRTVQRTSVDKLALQTAVVHLCCSVACIIIGIFSLAIIKSKTVQRVYGLPLWIGLLLLLTGFAGIQSHLKKTKIYAAAYFILSFSSMFFNLIGIAWMLNAMKSSEAAVISLVCVSTFDMGVSCLSTALGCNMLFTDCKICKQQRRHPGSRQDSSHGRCAVGQLGVDVSVSIPQDSESGGVRESVCFPSISSGQARYVRQYPPRPGDEPPSYTEAIGPPPPYSHN